MIKHTPAPWKISSSVLVCGIDARIIASCYQPLLSPDMNEAIANAHLIASAPELLEALKDFKKWYINLGRFNPEVLSILKENDFFDEWVNKSEQAITKAEGN